jgi:hypothetical protein
MLGMFVLLLAASGLSSGTSESISEMEIRGGRGMIHTVSVNTYEFAAEAVPPNLADWAPDDDVAAVTTSIHEYDRNGWVLSEELTVRGDEPYRFQRNCRPSRKFRRECSLKIPPDGIQFGTMTVENDIPFGLRYLSRLDHDADAVNEYREWWDKDTHTIHSKSGIRRSSSILDVTGTRTRYLSPNGYVTAEVKQEDGQPEVRFSYERLAVDAFGNATRMVQRQDPKFPDPRNPGTVRLNIVEFSYYEMPQ